jgi:hypothetical protein
MSLPEHPANIFWLFLGHITRASDEELRLRHFCAKNPDKAVQPNRACGF